MPPKVRFQKEEIVTATLNVARKEGIDSVTAREVAKELGVSVGPIFTWYETMEQLKIDVSLQAKRMYREYIERGLSGPVPCVFITWKHGWRIVIFGICGWWCSALLR